MAGATSFKVLFLADASSAKKEIAELERSAGGLGNSMDATGKIAGMALLGIGAAAAGGLGAAIGAAANFEQAMDQVGAVVDLAGVPMDALNQKALDIGKNTMFGATDAAAAMEVLAANGINARDIIGGAADAAVSLAAAGGTDLARAADTISTSMAVWNLTAEQTVDVTNRLAGAANVSRFGVEDMSAAIAMGGGAAAAAGVEFGDFTTAIAAIAPSFSSGSDAGTSFKAFVASLPGVSGPASKALADLGIITADGTNRFYDASGKLKSMADVTQILHDALGPLSEQQRTVALTTIFGSDAMRTAAAMSKLTGDEFKAMDAKMAATDAAEVARKRMENLKGSLEALKGSLETVAVEVGTRLLPVLTRMADFAAQNLPAAFAAAERALTPWVTMAAELARRLRDELQPTFDAIAPKVEAFVGAFRENETAMQAAAIVVGTVLVGAFAALAISAGAAAVSVIATTAPFLAVAAAVGLVIAGIVLLVQHWDEATAKFPILQTIVDDVQARFAAFSNWITGDFLPAFDGLVEAGRTAMEALAGFIGDNWDAIEKIFGGAWTAISGIVEGELTIIQGLIEGALKVITGVINVFTGLLTGDWDRAWDGIKQIVDGVLTAVTGLIKGEFAIFEGLFRGGAAVLTGVWELLWAGLRNFMGNVWAEIENAISGAVSTIVQKFWDLYHWATAPIDSLMNKLGSIKGKIDDVVNGLGKIGGKIPGLASGTLAAPPGWAWVGEQGPELVRFRGGEQVLPAGQSKRMAEGAGPLGGGAGGVVVNIYGNVNARDEAEARAAAGNIGYRAMLAMRARGLAANA